MSWLERVTRPKPHSSHKTTTLVLHRHDSDPIIHNLRGLWFNEALLGVLAPLVQEYYDEHFEPICEILWQDGEKQWGEEVNLVIHLRLH